MNDQPHIDEDAPDEFLFVWACGLELAIGLAALGLAWVLGIDARAYLGRIDQLSVGKVGLDILIGAAAAVPMLVAIKFMMMIPHDSINAIKRLGDAPTMKMLLSLSSGELIAISLCAGIGEELAFRGCLLPWLTAVRDASGQVVNPYDVGDSFRTAVPALLAAAVLVSSVGFGMLHPFTKTYVVIASLMGVYFAGLLIATDSLLVPIVAHAVYDAAQFLVAKREFAAEQVGTSNGSAETR